MSDIKKQEKKINNKNEKFIFENKVLNNGMILEKLDLSAHLNLFYAKNGTAKTSIYNFLKNDFPKKLNNEYEIITYSYLEELKNKNSLFENLKKLNLLNDSKELVKSNNQLNDLINSIKKEYSIFLNSKEFLIDYSKKRFIFNKNNSEKESSFELFMNDLNYFINDVINEKKLISDFVYNFFTYDFNLDKIDLKNVKEILNEIEKFNYELRKEKEKNEKLKRVHEENINNLNKKKELKKDEIESIKNAYNKEINKLDYDLTNLYNKYISISKDKILKLFFYNNYIYSIRKYDLSYGFNNYRASSKVVLSELIDWIIKNSKIFSYNDFNLNYLKFFLENIYFFDTLFKFSKVNNNFHEELLTYNLKSFKEKINKVIILHKNISNKKSKRKFIEKVFNNFFFDYISFSIVKTIDLLFLEQSLNVNIYLHNRLLNINDEIINNLSDGELNAILLVAFYIKCIESKKPFILLMDDASVAFDRNNWLGLLRLLLQIFLDKKNNGNKLILFSHDSSFIRISSKFFRNNMKEYDLFCKGIINENNIIRICDSSLKNNDLLKNNFLLLHFFELLKYSNADKKKFNIKSMLHYSNKYFINDFIKKLSISNADKKKLKNYAENKYNLNLKKNSVFDLFESLYNNENKNLYLIDFFYLRFLIEKFVSNYSEKDCINGTIKFIDNSKLNKEKKEKLKNIYNYLPTFIHCEFFDIAYLLNFNNNETIANFIDEVKEMINDYEKNKLKN